jgi:DNA-directed RNA polymerase subunit L
MSSKIKIKEKKYIKHKDLTESHLLLEFNNVDSSIINSLRRVSCDEVPSYSFCEQSILIELNSSRFDNDYMRMRLSQFTIPNIANKISYLDDKFWKNIDYKDTDRLRHSEDSNTFQLIINSENNTNDVINITTNDCLLIFNDKKIEAFNKKYPHLIIKLKPNESFKCRAEAVLGIGLRSNIWSPIRNAYYEEINENNFLLNIKSFGQLQEYDILIKSCDIINHKLNIIKKNINSNKDIGDDKQLIMVISNENHTIGNILTTILQKNKNISYAGYNKPDLLINEIRIKIKSINKTPIFYLLKTCDDLINIYNNIKNQLKNLKK